ncbi:MAG: hypothetical protein GYA59_10795, partial [Chloroflexi bacterium]|nr:hypothetical protein [Chloroflexota bacterium]
FGALLLVLLVVGPLAVRLSASPTSYAEIICPSGEEAVYLRYDAGSSIHILKEDVFHLDWMPDFHQGRFARQVHGLPDPQVAQEFEQIAAPATILYGLELRSQSGLWLVVDTRLLPSEGHVLGVCGHWTENSNVAQYRFFYASTVEAQPGP